MPADARKGTPLSARNRLLMLPLVPLLATAWLTPAQAAPKAPPAPCANLGAINVPGAALQRVECQPDLSATVLAAKGRSDVSDWAGLHSKKTVNPPAGVGSRSTATSRTTRRRTRPMGGTTTPSS